MGAASDKPNRTADGTASADGGEPSRHRHFIQDIIDRDMQTGKWSGRVHTRFPPEPNGYLHIGHAKSICLNFGLAKEYPGGKCNLRFDDTNPSKEEQEYVDSITRDVQWLGGEWDALRYASDYFDQMYAFAEELIQKGKAFVCDLTGEQVSKSRGTLTSPGTPSPFRNRSVEENLEMFRRMRSGEFPDGARTLRAKIDMAHANMNLRDPVMYRILHAHHHRQGDKWNIYPMYDWAHGFEDSIEGITHSICTLEFEDHRPLYDWFIAAVNEGRGPGSHWGLPIHHPQQIEFARLELTYTMMSKRKLLELVQEKHVRGWDDPRMPTLSGMRRRGYTPEAIRHFCEKIGVAKFNSTIDFALLEHCIRDDLNKTSPRVMAVLKPLRVVIDNYPDGQTEELDAVNNPEDPSAGTRKVPFSKVLYIEQDDFREEPPPKYFRLSPGREVRLRWAYFITCQSVVKDPKTGEVIELHCTYDPATRGGDAPDGRKVKATIHWVSAQHALSAEVRLYDHLFTKEDPNDVGEATGNRQQATGAAACGTGFQPVSACGTGLQPVNPNRDHEGADVASPLVDGVLSRGRNEIPARREPARPLDYRANINPSSLAIIADAKVEPSVCTAAPGARFQFERQGYFCLDPDSTTDPNRAREEAVLSNQYRPGAPGSGSGLFRAFVSGTGLHPVDPSRPDGNRDQGAVPVPSKLVFNRTVTLKNTWAKIEKKG